MLYLNFSTLAFVKKIKLFEKDASLERCIYVETETHGPVIVIVKFL